jgi:predicted nucleic acid-binding protein
VPITIDTSIFVEMILAQERADDCRLLFDFVAEGEIEAIVSHFAIHAIEVMFPPEKQLSEFLEAIESSKGLKVYDTSLIDEKQVALLSKKTGLDFDDSIQLYVAKVTSSSTIVSFDRHFDNLDIPRSEPSQILRPNRKTSNK